MKAFILAAGIGTRLRPLTYHIPKPMFPIVNKPVLEHTIELVRRYGIKDIIMNLHYHPQIIKHYFGDGSHWGLKIHYSDEKELLGTAGGVKRMQHLLKDSFLIISGDGLTDIDLGKLYKFHMAKKSIATMVLKPVDTRFEYGVTLTDKSGRIKKFIEKPAWKDVFSNTVNTGIYLFNPEVLNYIPEDTFYDFGRDLWPSLLSLRKPIYGYVTEAYWCDIGNLAEYRRAEKDVLEGKVKISLPGKQTKKCIWIDRNTTIHPTAKLYPPCLIGKNSQIGRNVIIDRFTVIGNECTIKSGARIGNSILWNKVVVENQVGLSNCIIGNNARVTENISVFEGAVINIRT